jgi:hypothetical protein
MWKFKHPTADDFIHVMELQSGMVLDWYNEYFVNTTKTIDYSITSISGTANKSTVTLKRIGLMPMPLEVEVLSREGKRTMYYIPLDLMRGEKSKENYPYEWKQLPDWKWVSETYTIEIPMPATNILSIQIDPFEMMADIEKENNIMQLEVGENFKMKN